MLSNCVNSATQLRVWLPVARATGKSGDTIRQNTFQNLLCNGTFCTGEHKFHLCKHTRILSWPFWPSFVNVMLVLQVACSSGAGGVALRHNKGLFKYLLCIV